MTRSDTYDYDRWSASSSACSAATGPPSCTPSTPIRTSRPATRPPGSGTPSSPGYSDHGDHTAVACFTWAALAAGSRTRSGTATDTGVHHDRLPRLLQPALAQEPPAAGAPGEGRPPRPVRRGPVLAVRQPLGLRRLRRRRRPAAHQPQGLGALHPPPLAERGPGARPGAGRLPHRVRGARAARGPLARAAPGVWSDPPTSAAARSRPRSARRRSATAGCCSSVCGSPPSTGTAARTGRAGAPGAALPRRPVPGLARAREPGARGRPGAPGRCPGGRHGPRRPGPSLRTERGQGRLDPGPGGGRVLGSVAGAPRGGGGPGRARGLARRDGPGARPRGGPRVRTALVDGAEPAGPLPLSGSTVASAGRRPVLPAAPSGELLGPAGDAGLDGYGGLLAARSTALGTVLLGTDPRAGSWCGRAAGPVPVGGRGGAVGGAPPRVAPGDRGGPRRGRPPWS